MVDNTVAELEQDGGNGENDEEKGERTRTPTTMTVDGSNHRHRCHRQNAYRVHASPIVSARLTATSNLVPIEAPGYIPAASIRSSRRGWRRGDSLREANEGRWGRSATEPSPAKTTAGNGRTGNAEDSDGLRRL